MAEVVERRRAEQRELIALARGYVERLARRVEVTAAVVVGSVARGDFNRWSDVDVVVVAPRLPGRLPERQRLVGADAPAGVQPVAFTPAELVAALGRRNALAREAVEGGVVLQGAGVLAELRRTATAG